MNSKQPLITPLPEVRLDNVNSDVAMHPIAQNQMGESSAIIPHRFIKKNSLIAMHRHVVVYLCLLAHVPWQLHIVVEKTNNIIKIDGKMIKIHIV